MKTLVRPQVRPTIAISRDQKYKKDLYNHKLYSNSVRFFFLRSIFLISSLSIFIFVSDSPQLHADLCNKYNSQQVCNVW